MNATHLITFFWNDESEHTHQVRDPVDYDSAVSITAMQSQIVDDLAEIFIKFLERK